jgi:hypothetical protein
MDLPHFTVTTDEGASVAYDDLWQRKNLVLIVVEPSAEARDYIERLRSRLGELTAYDTACVVTADRVEGFGRPAAVIADRWGEVYFSVAPGSVSQLPSPDELIGWLRYVQMQCPECQGEAR